MTAEMRVPFHLPATTMLDGDSIPKINEMRWLTGGPLVERFERELSDLYGGKHVITTTNCASALELALRAIGVVGCEVILPTMTFAATANAIVRAGATPVFVDVEKDTLMIDPECVRRAITEWTRVVIAVDYGGCFADYPRLREVVPTGIWLLADAAHSLGSLAKWGTSADIADAACLSFHATKTLTTGEGGAVVTKSVALAQTMRVMRQHGMDADARDRELGRAWKYDVVEYGSNFRMTEMQAAIGLAQMPGLSDNLLRRLEIASEYGSRLPDACIRPVWPDYMREVAVHLYPIRVQNRDEVIVRLLRCGVQASVHYEPVHMKTAYLYSKSECPVAEVEWETLISLPIYPQMDDRQVDFVIEALMASARED